MLRRKLLLMLGGLVIILAGVSALAIWQLQGVLERMERVNTEAMGLVENANALGARLTAVEVELYELELGRQRHLETLIAQVEGLEGEAARMEARAMVRQGPGEAVYRRMAAVLPRFRDEVGALATTRDPGLAHFHNQEALRHSVALRRDILELTRLSRAHAQDEQTDLAARFRWLVLGLAIVFLLVINVTILLLWRMASMVLRPVGELVAASRLLAREQFDHRVRLNQHDEFDELGRAFNRLAEQLGANEQRKMEMLGQVALTLNHELNNAIAIIEMQLSLLSQRSGGPDAERYLRQIHDNLERMTRTVQSLKNIRRVVLTDYAGGAKMLDLERSTRPDAD